MAWAMICSIMFDEHAELLYKLAGQVVAHLQSYLPSEEGVLNVLQYHQQSLVNLIHAQMQDHYEESAAEYDAHVSKGFRTLTENVYTSPAGENVRDYRVPVDEKLLIRGMIFGGFRKCLYRKQKFDTDTERRFAVILETDGDVLKWFKPGKGVFQIDYRHNGQDASYEPDFVAETPTARYLCEPKRAREMNDGQVLAKANAATVWCEHATAHGGKPWDYLLIPHNAIAENKTLAGFAAAHTFRVARK